jgi:hypothetical protein
MRLRWRFLLVVFAAILLRAISGSAQDASLVGTITDETKAVLPGVTVTAINLETGVESVAASDERGDYRLPKLAPGKYKVKADLAGFASVVVPSVELLVGQNAAVPFTLRVASVGEEVTVTGGAPLIDLTTSVVGGNVDRQQMDQLPIQGRNWMELSMMVKGITANSVTVQPGVSNDDFFQLNLDGQQISQKLASSSFGQPAFSRDAIAEFQIATNSFDITQGRSAGIQVQAISKSGTNTPSGSLYGFFRNDAFNAADPVSHTVLPFSDQQAGGTMGGPIILNKLHYFASYEYERNPSTIFSTPVGFGGQTFTLPTNTTQRSILAKLDDVVTPKNQLSLRGSRWDSNNPFSLGGNGYPSTASALYRYATNILGTWSNVINKDVVQQLRLGYDDFYFGQTALGSVAGAPEFDFPGLTIGAPYNLPSIEWQREVEARYELNMNKGSHALKIGGEFMHVAHTGYWGILESGRFTMSSIPSTLSTLIPQSAAFNPTTWNLSALNSYVNFYSQNFNQSGWKIDVPRPEVAVWFGDTWKLRKLSLNYGVRWDDDLGVFSPPNVPATTILISNGLQSGDFGYKDNIHDHRDFAPRGGFAYEVTPTLVIRGGSGLYYSTPYSNLSYSQQVFSETITGSFTPPASGKCADGSLFITNPTCGVTAAAVFGGTVALPAQSPRIISPDFKNPYTWQSSIGVQKQLNDVTSVDVDLTHYTEYRAPRSYNPNLFYDPTTGYNVNPSARVPNAAYGQIIYYTSNGTADQTEISSSVTRRFKHSFQTGLTYTLMLSMHDDGSLGISSPGANNQFNYLAGEYATSTDFQRNTLRAWLIYQLPLGFNVSVSEFYGSGTRYAATIGTTPYGKPGSNRLNLLPTGAAAPTIVIPADVADRWDGPTTITSGTVIPRNALEGTPLYKTDLRVTKEIRIYKTLKGSLIGEVYNVFNHANYASFNTTLNPTNAAVTAVFGQPVQNTANAYIPREGQLAFRLSF